MDIPTADMLAAELITLAIRTMPDDATAGQISDQTTSYVDHFEIGEPLPANVLTWMCRYITNDRDADELRDAIDRWYDFMT